VYNIGFKIGIIMAKTKTQYVCNNCGATAPKFMGKCTSCNQYNTMEEEVINPTISSSAGNNRYQSFTKISSKIENLEDVSGSEYERVSTEIAEFDRVLGGGLVDGGVILLGGDPGIGKSTLVLQTVNNLAKTKKVLYISGEESPHQIAMRRKRLGLEVKGVRIHSEIELEKIQAALHEEKPDYVIIHN
jgi:DNA repair protein RadA/Sms